MNKAYLFITKIALNFNNFIYKIISILSIKTEGGIHPKHRLMGYHKFFIDNLNPEDIVMDVGCGNGALSFDVAEKVRKVVAIDLSKKNIEFAKQKFSAPNIEYIVGDATKELPEKKFDAIILSNVLEHIKDRLDFLSKIKSQGSKMLIRVPMINRDWITLYKKELGLEWRLDKSHFTEYTLESFQKELKMANLNLIKFSIQFGEIWSIVN